MPEFRVGQRVATPAGNGRVVLTVADQTVVMVGSQVHRFRTVLVTAVGGMPYAS